MSGIIIGENQVKEERKRAITEPEVQVEGNAPMTEEEMEAVEKSMGDASGIIESMAQLEDDRKNKRGMWAITKPLWEHIDEIITTFCAAFPMEMADFKHQVETRRRMAANKHHVAQKGVGAESAPHIEYRTVLTFPQLYDRHGELQELLPVLQGAFERYGYPDFPQLERHAVRKGNVETWKVTREFISRYGHMFMLPEKY